MLFVCADREAKLIGISSQGAFPAEATGEQGAFLSFMFVWLQADRAQAMTANSVIIIVFFIIYSSSVKALVAVSELY